MVLYFVTTWYQSLHTCAANKARKFDISGLWKFRRERNSIVHCSWPTSNHIRYFIVLYQPQRDHLSCISMVLSSLVPICGNVFDHLCCTLTKAKVFNYNYVLMWPDYVYSAHFVRQNVLPSHCCNHITEWEIPQLKQSSLGQSRTELICM